MIGAERRLGAGHDLLPMIVTTVMPGLVPQVSGTVCA
jgi:hypothetical protein